MGPDKKFWFLLKISLFLILKINMVTCIVGGAPTSITKYPFLVLIAYEVPNPCSGTIIMSNWVLTAAKCIHHTHVGIDGLVGVRIGVTNKDIEKGLLIRKKAYFTHPNFISDASFGSTVNDIGLIQLVKYLEYGPNVQPVKLALARQTSPDCKTLGWGIINANIYLTAQIQDRTFWAKDGENVLKEIGQRIYEDDLSYCSELLRPVREYPLQQGGLDTEFHICAQEKHGWPNKLNGPAAYDYGGPLLCPGNIQVGIFSFSLGDMYKYCHWVVVWTPYIRTKSSWIPQAAAYYTPVYRYIEWIDHTIEIAENTLEFYKPRMPNNSIWPWYVKGSKHRVGLNESGLSRDWILPMSHAQKIGPNKIILPFLTFIVFIVFYFH